MKLKNPFNNPIILFIAVFCFVIIFLDFANLYAKSIEDSSKIDAEAWIKDIDVESVSLIFAAPDLGNAPSAFGHVFLKLNSAKNKNRTGLLDYGVNFSAKTGDIQGALYAWYGLLGYFQGAYSLMPFHQLIKDYTHLEGRDIWEYRLRLTPNQVQDLVRLILSEDKKFYDYYFFHGNCASYILKLIQKILPECSLISLEKNEFFILPVEVLQRLQINNLLDSWIYRPSLETEWREFKKTNPISKDKIQIIKQEKIELENIKSFSSTELEAGQKYWMIQSIQSQNKQDYFAYRNNEFLFSKSLARLNSNLDQSNHSIKNSDLKKLNFNDKLGFRWSFGKQQSDLVLADTNKYKEENYWLEFRPLMYHFFDAMPASADFSDLELLKLKLKLKYQKTNFNSEELNESDKYNHKWMLSGTLLSIFNSKPIDDFEKPVSWGVQWGVEDLMNVFTEVGYGIDVFDFGTVDKFENAESINNSDSKSRLHLMWYFDSELGAAKPSLEKSKYWHPFDKSESGLFRLSSGPEILFRSKLKKMNLHIRVAKSILSTKGYDWVQCMASYEFDKKLILQWVSDIKPFERLAKYSHSIGINYFVQY